jgi:galactose mutarotase-like enzyme
MPPVSIASEVMEVSVLPDYGARVVGLRDRRTGRDWLAPGAPSPQTGEGAVYRGAEAVGWDECFPTVSPWDGTQTLWRRPLRDHGDLWGRPWSVDEASRTVLATSFAGDLFRFSRTLSVDGPTLTAAYRLDNRAADDMPYLWALHGLLAVTPADRIVLPAVDSATATYLQSGSHVLDANSVSWPETNGVLPFPLDAVQGPATGFAGKLYAEVPASASAAIGHDGQWLRIGWDASITTLGIWLNYGGWPAGPGSHHIAIEPTTAPADHLGDALDAGRAAWLKPGASASWTITLTLAEDAA